MDRQTYKVVDRQTCTYMVAGVSCGVHEMKSFLTK